MTPESVHAHICDVADAVDAKYGLSAASARWSDLRYAPWAQGEATLHLDDVSGVPFLQDIVGVQFYQLRTRVRAGDGDFYVAACPGLADYERYCRDQLRLGSPTFVQAEPTGPPIEVARASLHGEAFKTLVRAAKTAGAFTVHPYMGIAPVWALGRAIAQAASVPVRVLAPPPDTTTFANDKACVTMLARALVNPVLGYDTTIETTVAQSAEDLTPALVSLAARHPAVALKMTRFASAMGNRVFDAAALLAETPAGQRALVDQFLADKGWVPGQDVLAVAWHTDAPSPSTQLWIPASGPPRLDGVYDQLLVGPERVFLGSVPSTLPSDVQDDLGRASLLMAAVYQRLGYVGRCSFDFIVVDGRPKFVECNGRWGGTSTPMHLVDRLFPSGRPTYRARDFVSPDLVGSSFQELATRLGASLYDPSTGRGRYILYNVGCLEPFGKFDVIALGETLADASRALEDELPTRLM